MGEFLRGMIGITHTLDNIKLLLQMKTSYLIMAYIHIYIHIHTYVQYIIYILYIYIEP
jgi:hypothetical protein